MRRRFVIAAAFGFLFITACSGQQSVPNGSSYADSAAATRRVDSSLSNVGPATARWGVEGSGTFDAGAATNFDFCNGVLNPSSGCADPPIEYGVKSFSEGDSGASSTCDENLSKGADCSSTVSVKPALGTIEGSLSLKVSGLSKDGNYYASVAYAMGSSDVVDYVTPTSRHCIKARRSNLERPRLSAVASMCPVATSPLD